RDGHLDAKREARSQNVGSRVAERLEARTMAEPNREKCKRSREPTGRCGSDCTHSGDTRAEAALRCRKGRTDGAADADGVARQRVRAVDCKTLRVGSALKERTIPFPSRRTA